MVIRGAPAIGVAAAMGLAFGMRRSAATGTQKFAAEFQKACELMASTRPTAVNLFWAIERMKRSFATAAQAGESVDQIKDRLDFEAQAIHDEDVASCRRGWALRPPDDDASGRTATPARWRCGLRHRAQSSVGPEKRGKHAGAPADETRPFLQGAVHGGIRAVTAFRRPSLRTT
jgi:methylthioribose-1-phosphate isomerase